MSDEIELGYQEFTFENSYTSMPDQRGVKFIVYDPLPDDASSGPIVQFGSCPRQDFPFQAQIHPGKIVLEWEWMVPDTTAYVVRDGAVVLREEESSQ